MAPRILVSAGEASGDLYAACLVRELAGSVPGSRFFGCAGPRMREAGVEPVVDAASLSVVGLVEVLGHLPRIYGEYRRLIAAARRERPDLAILTDSPDFHLRLAGRLKSLGIPVVYLVAPQVWAWRKGRIRAIRRNIDRLLCIFPFEEDYFRWRGVRAHYVGHPLVGLVKPSVSRKEFFSSQGLDAGRPLVTLLPGSRRGEALRHMPALMDAVRRLAGRSQAQFVLALPAGFWNDAGEALERRIGRLAVRVVRGRTWDAMASATLAMAASGTVTVEAALLGVPLVTFYRVSGLTWHLGRSLVDVPFYSMVNLVAGRAVVPELIQNEMTGERLAEEALRLLEDPARMSQMRAGLSEVASRLASQGDPVQRAARIVRQLLKLDQGVAHVI